MTRCIWDKMILKNAGPIVLIVFLILLSPVMSVSGAEYELSWSTIDGGGGTNYGVYGSGSTGVFGVGTTYDFYASGIGVDYGSSSSIRWKNNIRPIDSPLEKVMNLRGVYYNWDAEHGGSHDLGMIAEEVGEVLPEIVQYEENGIDAEGMDYSKLTPLLVEAVKALKIQADERQKQLAEKDVEIAGFKDHLSKLENVVTKLDRMQKGGR